MFRVGVRGSHSIGEDVRRPIFSDSSGQAKSACRQEGSRCGSYTYS